jgi:hypothetical protein
MLTLPRLFQVAGGILIAVLMFAGTTLAAETDKPLQGTEQMILTAEAMSTEGQVGKKTECKEPLPCARRHPKQGETAENGAFCSNSTGWVCSSPYPTGQACGFNGSGTCHTYDLGNGLCDCQCVGN